MKNFHILLDGLERSGRLGEARVTADRSGQGLGIAAEGEPSMTAAEVGRRAEAGREVA
ncbi:MAG: hypothetical protein ACP5PM_07830 [Acidimicrobiales bacterium]